MSSPHPVSCPGPGDVCWYLMSVGGGITSTLSLGRADRPAEGGMKARVEGGWVDEAEEGVKARLGGGVDTWVSRWVDISSYQPDDG